MPAAQPRLGQAQRGAVTDRVMPSRRAPDLQEAVGFSGRSVVVEFTQRRGAPNRRVLDALDFDIRRGEFVSLLGGSGVGKTTLLRALGGLHPVAPTSKLTCWGQPIDGPPDRVVTVFQNYSESLLPWRTVERNVGLGLEGRVAASERREVVRQALEMVGLTESAGDYPWQLSGGMQQRVQIARAIVMQPLALLMDEPFGALDAMTKASLQDSLLRIHSQTAATVVFVTHDVEEAVYMSDRIFVLVGSPARLGAVVEVDLARPRSQVTTKEQPRYLELRHRVFEALGGLQGENRA